MACMKKAGTHLPTTIERKVSELIAQVLEVGTIAEARRVTLQRYSEWFDLSQCLWVGEPRTFAKIEGQQSLLLHALAPVEQSIAEVQLVFRGHNPVLKIMLADPTRGPLGPLDVISAREWQLNPFRAEVNDPLGFTHVVSFQIDEGEASRDTIFMPVLARSDRKFSAQEIDWLNLTRVILQPIFTHIRGREELVKKTERSSNESFRNAESSGDSSIPLDVARKAQQGNRHHSRALTPDGRETCADDFAKNSHRDADCGGTIYSMTV